ncbi:LuxR family transcriptional regulator [Brevibacterium litoralis]|uniref:LuxR family transcriptional regulator n=1 Tax=Brevibacterium litoralis TaxID=3138935 RepID=UPI0032EE653C
MTWRARKEQKWPLWGMAGFAALGVVIGITAMPHAWVAVLAMAVAQLASTAFGVFSDRRPALWAAAIASVSLGTVVSDARLRELAYLGGIPWIGLATAMATFTLYRRARSRAPICVGTVALVISSAILVLGSVQAGVPPTSAVLAASVPFLLGIIIALVLHLGGARRDRIHLSVLAEANSGETSSGPGTAPGRGAATSGVDAAVPESACPAPVRARAKVDTAGASNAARRALAVVALRSDELIGASDDPEVRRSAREVRDVASRALASVSEEHVGEIRIEVHSDGAQRATGAGTGNGSVGIRRPAEPMPDMPDREREILRHVSTGASNASIARSLYLSEATVKQYVSRLMRRFDRGNRTQLALMAARWFEDD